MPPKKREKETDMTKSTRIDHIQADHELFLQAFEKPTQIYRYLRTRNMFQPMFLNRTLSYMKQRMSRNHKSREGFKVDSILETVRQKNRNESQSHCMDNYMTLTFLGFYDSSLDEKQCYQIKVETLLLKICHKKRKDSSSAIVEVSVGCCSVPLNPSIQDPPAMASAVSISSEAFRPSQGPDLITYELLLRVAIQNPQNLSTRNNNEIRNGDSDEPAHKRSKPSETLRELGSELIVYDKHNQCLLKAGEYDLELRDTLPAVRSPHKTSKSTHWETLPEDMDIAADGNPFEVFNKRPKLKLKLSWSQEPSNGVVSRPKPYQLRSADNRENKAESNISNKENNRPSSNCSRLNNIMNKKSSADGKTNGHSSTVSSETKEACGETPQITYQFLYNNNSRQQTEACEDLHCPWCSIDCGTLYSLLKHLKFCHSRFSFTYTPIPKGARIDVAINDLYDGSYSGPPHATYNGGRVGPTRRSILTHILVCKPPGRRLHAARTNAPANNLAEFLESDDNEMADGRRPYMTGHDRLYHHTVTCLPVLPKELEGDSEEETDPLWLQQKTMMMIDEFTDVNEGEKELMKMWNLHVMKYNFVGDCQTQIACQMFLQTRGRELLEKNLYRNFILHMSSLHDFGLITPIGLYQTVQMLNEILQESPVGKQKLRENILLQREHWKAVGMHQQPTVVEPKAVKPSTFTGFHGEASPVVRRKTSNLQTMNRMASSSYSAQLSAASGNLDSKKKSDASSNLAVDTPQRRKSIPAPMISVVLAKNASSVPQVPLRRKSAGNNQAVTVQNRKRLSLEERKNST